MRASWKGNIQLGVFNAPVKLYKTAKDKKIQFRSLCPDCETPLKRGNYYCPECGREVEYGERKRGYQVGKDEFVVLENEELESLRLKRSKTIELKGFIQNDAMDERFLSGREYYVVPQEGGKKPYKILAERLGDRIGLGKVVFRRKEHLIGITERKGQLHAQVLRYADEIRERPNFELPQISDKERETAEEMISEYTITPNWEEFSDTYSESVKELVKKKLEGEPVEIKRPKVEEEEEKSAVEMMKATIESE